MELERLKALLSETENNHAQTIAHIRELDSALNTERARAIYFQGQVELLRRLIDGDGPGAATDQTALE